MRSSAICSSLVLLAVLIATAAPATPPANYTETIGGTKVGFEMIGVPGGKFTRGSREDGPEHSVTVSPFWIGKTEVTWDEYEVFYFQTEGAATRDPKVDAVTRPTPPYIPPDLGWGRGTRPAVSMSHFAATKYCEWLAALTGKKYRLSTSAEWEYACRAGSKQNHLANADEVAWHKGNSDDMSQEVAQKKPNAWGLFDMLGNVSEFTADRFSQDDYKRFAPGAWPRDPQGPEKGSEWVIRGGSYKVEAAKLACGVRMPSTEADCLVTDPNIPKSKWWYSDCWHIGIRVARGASEE